MCDCVTQEIKNHGGNRGNFSIGIISMENINPNEKTSQTQNSKILKALLNGERLTQLDAYTRFNCTRLGARIYDLKQRGHKIEKQMVVVASGKRVAEYRLVV